MNKKRKTFLHLWSVLYSVSCCMRQKTQLHICTPTNWRRTYGQKIKQTWQAYCKWLHGSQCCVTGRQQAQQTALGRQNTAPFSQSEGAHIACTQYFSCITKLCMQLTCEERNNGKNDEKFHKMPTNVEFLSALIRYDTLCTSVCLVHFCLCKQHGAVQHPNIFPAGEKNNVTRSGA